MTHRGPFDPAHPFGRASAVSANGKRVKRQIHVPESLYHEIRLAARREGVSMAALVASCVRIRIDARQTVIALRRRLP